jgi:hypothetical protein
LKAGLIQSRHGALTVVGAFLFGVSLMVDDELFTYMTLGLSRYQFPLIGYFALWDAWALDFGFIVLSVGLMLYGVYKSRSA